MSVIAETVNVVETYIHFSVDTTDEVKAISYESILNDVLVKSFRHADHFKVVVGPFSDERDAQFFRKNISTTLKMV